MIEDEKVIKLFTKLYFAFLKVKIFSKYVEQLFDSHLYIVTGDEGVNTVLSWNNGKRCMEVDYEQRRAHLKVLAICLISTNEHPLLFLSAQLTILYYSRS